MRRAVLFFVHRLEHCRTLLGRHLVQQVGEVVILHLVEHVRQVAGIDHVGIGSDFDGIESVPLGLENVADYPNLFAELMRRGWSDEDLGKLAGLNVLRVFREAEAVAARLRKERPASDVLIEEVDGKR